jgi:hypothetical protein
MSTSKPQLAELVQSLHEQVSRLIAASEIDALGQADLRDGLVREQLRRAAELVRGAATLGSDQNPACLGILGRCLLEQLITALWAIRSLENAEAHQGATKAELAKAFKINLKAGKAKVKNKLTGEDVTAEFLETEQMKKIPKRKSVEEQAREADVLDLYTVFYRFMSLETHGRQNAPEQSSAIASLCEVHLQGIGAISRAIGQACVWWLLHRSWPDNESIRTVLGLNRAES